MKNVLNKSKGKNRYKLHKNAAKLHENIKVMYKINICDIIFLEICLHKATGRERSRIIIYEKKIFIVYFGGSVLRDEP